jgi:sugar lactone lactonase YvrE
LISPFGVVVDASGNVYVSDLSNKIRKITPDLQASILAGSGISGNTNGPGATASFGSGLSLAIGPDNFLYVGDIAYNQIRKVSSTGVVSLVAGSGAAGVADGVGSAATIGGPISLTVDMSGNVYFVNTPDYTIRKITPDGTVTTLAWSRLFPSARVAADSGGNLYIVDYQVHIVRIVTPDGTVRTIIGDEGNHGSDSTGNLLYYILLGLAPDGMGNLFVSDSGYNVILKVSPR